MEAACGGVGLKGGERGVCFEERRGLAGVVGWSVVIFLKEGWHA